MANLETLRQRALAHMTNAIENILNAGDEKYALPLDAKIPNEGKQPHIDLKRDFAIRALWSARERLNAIDIALAVAQRGKSDTYKSALTAIKNELEKDTYSASKCVEEAIGETKSAQIAIRLRSAERHIRRARVNVRLMESSFWRFLASGWFISIVILAMIMFGIFYYIFYGVTSLSAVQKVGSTTLVDNTAANFKYLSQVVTDSTDVTEKATKLLKAVKDLFSEIPLVIAAFGILAKGIARMMLK